MARERGAMHNPPSSPAAEKARPDQRTSLWVATLLSIILHMILAGGLATTSLGILPSQAPDNPTGTTIFKPRLAVDFPLEVAKAAADAPAHEKPLDVSLSARQPAATRQPSGWQPARNVAPQQVREPDEERKAEARTPQRSATADAARPEAARQLERSALDKSGPQTAKADTLTTKGEASKPASTPRPAAAAPRTNRVDRSPQATPSRQPREVALLPDAKPRVPASPRAAAAQREKAATPQAAAISRQATPKADRAAESGKPAPLALAASAADDTPARPTLRPSATQPAHRQASSARTPQAATDAAAAAVQLDADALAVTAGSAASAAAVATAARSSRADPSTAGGTTTAGSPSALARSQLSAASADAASRGEVALPAAESDAGGEGGAEGSTAAAAAPRPAARPVGGARGRGDADRSTAGGVIAGAAPGEGDVADEVGAGTPAAGAAAAIAGAGRDGRTTGDDDALEAAGDAGGGSLGRAEIAAGGDDGPAVQADALADAAVGEAAGDDGNAARNSAGGGEPGSAGLRPAARADRGGRRSAGETAISRSASAPAGAEASADEGDGLSLDGLEDPAAAIQLSSLAAGGGGRRAAADGVAAPAATVASLPRATAIVLPAEDRVREVAAPFANRAREKRNKRQTDSMVDRGLEFLRRAQRPDGRWQLGSYPGSAEETAPKLASDTAATGLALLSFLGAGHDHFSGPYRDTVRRGLEFLLSVQKNDGDLFVPADPLSNSCGWLYSHGIATMALCEAVGMTGDEIIRPAAERACGFITTSQHPDRGGWRYTPRSDADLSVSGWMLVALRSGQLARVPVEPRTLEGVRGLLDASTIPLTSAGAKNPLARFHYNARKTDQRPSELSTACMTALGTLMRLHTGWKKTDQQVIDNGRALAAVRPIYGSTQQKVRDCYLWYYISQVLVHTGGAEWDSWYASLDGTLSVHQSTSGPLAGSWDPLGATPDRWGQYGGRIYVTTLHLLTLEVPYRHLPTYSLGE
jgi:hypothetical protein